MQESEYATTATTSAGIGGNASSDNELELRPRYYRRVSIPKKPPFTHLLKDSVWETFFPEGTLRKLPEASSSSSYLYRLGAHIFPFLRWTRHYHFSSFKDDLVAGLTIGSLAIPQDIGYAKLAGLPPIYGLYTSFVPPLLYALLGVSREVAIGPVAVVSILLGNLARKEFPLPQEATSSCDTTSSGVPINAACASYIESYLALIFTTTFFTGLFQTALGFFRLGFVVDFLSYAAIVGFMAGAALTIALQQLKGLLGIPTAFFTRNTDIISVLRSVFTNTDKWNWETILIGLFFLSFLLLTRYIAKKKPGLFWVAAIAPLISVILSTLFVKITHVNKHGVDIVGHIEGHINPSSVRQLMFHGSVLQHALVIAVQATLIALTEGIAIGRTFASIRDYNIDANKEMIAFGAMNVVGSCTSCYVATGSFSRSAVNYNAGCKTPMANVVMSIMVLLVLAVATPLFHYTPNCILASIIMNAVLSLFDYDAMYKIWRVDMPDFIIMIGAFLGVAFYSIEVGLLIAVCLSIGRILLHVTRPHTAVLGNIPGTSIYRNIEQYPDSLTEHGILVVRIDAAIFFSNSNYLRERILRWVEDESVKKSKGMNLVPTQFLIIDLSPVTNIDTTGIHSLEDLLTNLTNKRIQIAFANPGVGVAQKMQEAGFMDLVGREWFFLTVGEAVQVCCSKLGLHPL